VKDLQYEEYDVIWAFKVAIPVGLVLWGLIVLLVKWIIS
jgi:hypothetical protein